MLQFVQILTTETGVTENTKENREDARVRSARINTSHMTPFVEVLNHILSKMRNTTNLDWALLTIFTMVEWTELSHIRYYAY